MANKLRQPFLLFFFFTFLCDLCFYFFGSRFAECMFGTSNVFCMYFPSSVLNLGHLSSLPSITYRYFIILYSLPSQKPNSASAAELASYGNVFIIIPIRKNFSVFLVHSAVSTVSILFSAEEQSHGKA